MATVLVDRDYPKCRMTMGPQGSTVFIHIADGELNKNASIMVSREELIKALEAMDAGH